MSTWHDFAPSSGDDHDCTNPACGLQAADEALHLVAIDCPAESCTDPSNTGPCVLVLAVSPTGEPYPECAYCGVRGDLAEPDEDFSAEV